MLKKGYKLKQKHINNNNNPYRGYRVKIPDTLRRKQIVTKKKTETGSILYSEKLQRNKLLILFSVQYK